MRLLPFRASASDVAPASPTDVVVGDTKVRQYGVGIQRTRQ